MVFTVDEFRSQLTGDGARPNLFQVQLSLPPFVGGAAEAQKMSFMCNTAQLPGSTLGTVQSYYFGREVKLAGNRTYPQWTVQVINDEDFTVRNAMERWHFAINGPVGNLRNQNAASVDGGYGADATVLQFAKTGEVVKAYKFIGLFPIDISPIELNWGANDQIEEFALTFDYQYWVSDDPASQS